MMNLKEMTLLVTAYDGVRKVEKAVGILTSTCEGMAYGKGESAVGKLSCLSDVIIQNSQMYKLWDKEGDSNMRFQTLFSVLCDDSLSAEERAKIILLQE